MTNNSLDNKTKNPADLSAEDMKNQLKAKLATIKAEKNKVDEEPQSHPPVDAKVEIEVDPSKMKAYVTVTPPENGGKHVTALDIKNALEKEKITYGIKEKYIVLASLKQAYGKKIVVAEGKEPVDGIEGKVEHFFDLNHKNQPKINEDGSVNYKDTGLITNIMEEKPICKMTLPVPSVDGFNVYGAVLKGKPAPALKIPKGKNTYVTEDQTLLLAQKRGNLRLENGLYVIDDAIIINGDVDISVGDIKFIGRVEVRGNILEGFCVKSDSDIIVSGMVEGAVVEAKGNMDLRGGISGMGSSKISCKGDLKTKFIENADVTVGGNVDTDYILNSNLSCNGTIKCVGRKGIIVGGNCSAMDNIEVKSIGNDNGSKTNITVGVTSELSEKRSKLVSEINETKLERDKCHKDLQYLSFKEKSGDLSNERKEVFEKLKARLPMIETKLKILNAEQEKIQGILDGGRKSNIVCHGKIYPGVTITVASASLVVAQTIPRGKFILNDGEVMTIN